MSIYRSPVARGSATADETSSDDGDRHFLHHGNFVNHSLATYTMTKDPELRKRNAEVVKQLSPPRPASMDPSKMTAYERWYYSQREKILSKLEGGAGGASPAGGNSREVPTGAYNASPYKICPTCHGSLPRDGGNQSGRRDVPAPTGSPSQRQQQQIITAAAIAAAARGGGGSYEPNPSPPRALNGSTLRASSSSAPRALSTSQARSHASSAAIPGTQFEPLHPSHLYLHQNDVINHQFESLAQNPDETALRRLRESAKKSPTRPDDSDYARWWHTERDRLLAYVESKKAEKEASQSQQQQQ